MAAGTSGIVEIGIAVIAQAAKVHFHFVFR